MTLEALGAFGREVWFVRRWEAEGTMGSSSDGRTGESRTSDEVEVAVIGAGQAGLAVRTSSGAKAVVS
jgi:hypothetical protein